MEQSDENQKRASLLNQIVLRKKEDLRLGNRNYVVAQIQGWLTVVASFGSAIAAAAKAPSIAVAIIAAIPGTVILIDRNFGFGRRAKWYWEEYEKLYQLELALTYEGAQVSDISKRYGEIKAEMTAKWPTSNEEPMEGDKPR
jgi:hypothetical protein